MDGILKPRDEGFAQDDCTLDGNGFINKYPLPVGRAKSLTELGDEYAFFTPAILYLYARFRDAPLADFVYMVRRDCKFYFRKFDKPVFAGLEARSNKDPAWNFALWAVKREHWQPFSDWMVSLTLTYADTESVCAVGEQRLTVLDPLAVDRSPLWHVDLPQVEVTAFGVNGNRFQAGFAPAKDLLRDRPTLLFDKPDPAMLAFADALYGGSNPVDARTLYNHNKAQEESHEGETGREP
jgi:hypothetical protein